jgi:DNA polymerase-3 subunit beta
VKILEELKVILGSHKTDRKEKEKEEGKKEEEKASSQTVEVSLSKQQVEIQVGKTRLLSRLIDGKFPNYEQIIPKEAVTKVLFAVSEWTTIVKRMHYFAKEMNNTLTFHCADGQTRMITPQTQAGRDEATLQTDVNGTGNKIALSSSYLLDFLNHLDADTVEMRLQDSQRPAVFVVPEDPNFLHLIMPLRMQEE